ncbi:hypothetical protein [Methylobacterium trifolii]|uniref:DUF1311 domain-containing protein n=1 Tax=Methylobacterium trifolii TaxID=1003092 RepID=A0ABQ4TZA0_9HYPH|nr:hypothetical protein [Methylobacterium trifolii]GJE58925.1 hypothetical protein MPOCJGCO_1010 [Methylobacterium trifolii]
MRPTLSGTQFGTLALAAFAILAGPARADTVPSLDVEKTCKSAQNAASGLSDQANIDGCLRSERDARREAERRWGDYTPAAKKQCESQFRAGGYPSYVEMVTCLELASGTVPTQPDSGGKARAPEGTSNLTQEPPASQRTNPIEVLDKK